jgi:hypothetical protein
MPRFTPHPVVLPYFTEYVLAASAARTPTAGTNGATILTKYPWSYAQIIYAQTVAATDVGDTCDVYIDLSPDGGTTWVNAVHFTQRLGNGTDAQTDVAVLHSNTPGTSVIAITADASAAAVRPAIRGDAIRARWIIVNSGTADASFTFSVKAYVQ